MWRHGGTKASINSSSGGIADQSSTVGAIDNDDDDNDDDDDDEGDVPNSNSIDQPLLTYVGSSNFSERSWSRDFELGFLIHTTDRRVQSVVTEEYRQIMRHCTSHHGSDYVTNRDDDNNDNDDDASSQSSNSSSGCNRKNGTGDITCGSTESDYLHVLRSMRLTKPPLQSSPPVPQHSWWKQRMLHSMSRILRSFL